MHEQAPSIPDPVTLQVVQQTQAASSPAPLGVPNTDGCVLLSRQGLLPKSLPQGLASLPAESTSFQACLPNGGRSMSLTRYRLRLLSVAINYNHLVRFGLGCCLRLFSLSDQGCDMGLGIQ